MLGRTVLEVTLTSDVPAGFIVARIWDVHPDGASTRVAFGSHNRTHTPDHAKVTPLTPDAPLRLHLELDATGYRFLPGHRIRLAFSNAYWPLLWPAPQAATLTLDLASAQLTLPCPSATNDKAISFQAAEGATSRTRTQIEPSHIDRSATTENLTNFEILTRCGDLDPGRMVALPCRPVVRPAPKDFTEIGRLV